MNELRKNQTPSYTEARAKSWLSSLARGMQAHGQTVFMIEQLQPSWLLTSWQALIYILCSRLISGAIYGLFCELIFGCVFGAHGGLAHGLVFGLSIAVIDALNSKLGRSINRINKEPVNKYILGVVVCNETLFCLLSFLMILAIHINILNNARYYIDFYVSFIFGPFFGLLFCIRMAQRGLTLDIQPAETLMWSWPHFQKSLARSGCLILLMLAFLGLSVLCALLLFGPLNDAGNAVVTVEGALISSIFITVIGAFLFVAALIVAIFVGMRQGIRELKTIPNQGVRFSFLSALCGGLVGGLIAGVPIGLVPALLVWTFAGATLGLGVMLGTSLLSGLLAWFWFGGQDVIQHYVLRLVLFFCGLAPLNYVKFLDYADEELSFLQKVGGGYIFIHRILLEHFAAMEVEGMPKSQNSPPGTKMEMELDSFV